MSESRSAKRVAYSPAEFAELFGKSQTWGYRQIYAGKVNAITQHGRMLIPAKEVEKILESAGIYSGPASDEKRPIPRKNLTPEQQTIWQRFLASRRLPNDKPPDKKGRAQAAAGAGHLARTSVIRDTTKSRIAKGWGQK